MAGGASFDPAVRLIAIDPEAALVERAVKEMDGRLVLGSIADVRAAAETLIARAGAMKPRDGGWLAEARAALDNRPAAWASIVSQTPGRLHPAQVFRALRPYVERDPDTVLVCDGGEFAQWGQSMLPVRRRMINGVAGSIGGGLSFAIAARLAEPKAPVFAVLGDGTIGFHLAEFETAARRKLPFVAVLGNDALWNAESQIQLREYGAARMHGCDLTPARYDLAVAALGGHGEFVERADELPGAIERALSSGKPACINVMVENIAAPVIRLRSPHERSDMRGRDDRGSHPGYRHSASQTRVNALEAHPGYGFGASPRRHFVQSSAATSSFTHARNARTTGRSRSCFGQTKSADGGETLTRRQHRKEAAMAYATDHLEFTRYYDPATRAAGGPGLLQRVYEAFQAARQRKADRDVAAYIQRSGGRLTDSVERELMERISRSALGEMRRY